MAEARDVIAAALIKFKGEARNDTANGYADAIIAALSAEGLIVVPVEPTEAMKRAYHRTLCATAIDTEAGVDCWRAMISASTPPRAEKEK